MSSTEHIPANLMLPYLNQGHGLFEDNFYTSPKLAAHFLENDTHLCRTINPRSQNYLCELITERLEKDTAVFFKGEDKHLLEVKHM